MLYLIGGTSRVGKSTLASLILERNKISVISTDVVRNLLVSGPTKLNILEFSERERSDMFFPYFFQFLKILQNRYPDYVVEGDIFTAEQVVSMQERLGLTCCFLGTSSITVDDLINKDPHPNWVSKLPAEQQVDIPQRLVKLSEEFEAEAKKYGFPYFDIYPDRHGALESAYKSLFS